MDYRKILNEITEIRNSGLYDDEQMEAIKYISYRPDFDKNLILDPAIPGNIMLTYFKLATFKKIDISKYVNEKWHLKGFNSEQLYTLIFHHNLGHDISGITPDMDVEQIKAIMTNRLNEVRKKIAIANFSNLDSNQLEILNSLDRSVVELLLRHVKSGDDISILLKPNLKDFSYDQVCYMLGLDDDDILRVYNPNLSVKEMTEIMFNSPRSQEFLQMITENHNNRRK